MDAGRTGGALDGDVAAEEGGSGAPVFVARGKGAAIGEAGGPC